jgi:hypothetical protein
MNFVHSEIKFKVIFGAHIIIYATDLTTSIEYQDYITVDTFPQLSIDKVYRLLIDAFEGRTPESKITIERHYPPHQIILSIRVKAYLFDETYAICLNTCKEPIESKTSIDRLEYFNAVICAQQEEIRAQQVEIQALKNQWSEMARYLPWLRLWGNFIPANGSRTVCKQTDLNGKSISETAVVGGTVVDMGNFNPREIIIGADDISINGSSVYTCANYIYPIKSLLRIYNPHILTIRSINERWDEEKKQKAAVVDFIETELSAMTNVQRISIRDLPIRTVAQIIQLPNLVDLRLINCTKILDLHKLLSLNLQVLSISANMDTKIFDGVTKFSVVII